MDFDNPVFIFLAPAICCIIFCSIVVLVFGMSANSYLVFKKFKPVCYRAVGLEEINPEKPIIEDFEEQAFE